MINAYFMSASHGYKFIFITALTLIFILFYASMPSAEEKKADKISDKDKITEDIFTNFTQVGERFNETKKNILKNEDELKTLQGELKAEKQRVIENKEDVSKAKSLIEDNSVRLYEILIRVVNNIEKSEKNTKALNEKMRVFLITYKEQQKKINKTLEQKERQRNNNSETNRLWILINIILVSLAPLSFALSRSGQSKGKKGDFINAGGLIVWAGAFLAYFLFGFNFMYGESDSIWWGNMNLNSWHEITLPALETALMPKIEFFLYQAGFVSMMALIIFTILGHRFSLIAHICIAFLVAMVLFPLFGHWSWSGNFLPNNQGWLEQQGFVDIAGATLVHSMAAWFALILLLGKRNQTFNDPSAKNNMTYSAAGVFVLWLSWIGFAGGSLSIADKQLANILLNTSLAASAGGLVALFLHSLLRNKEGIYAHTLGGFVSGLVAISASGYLVSPEEALFIGAIASIIQNIAYWLLRKTLLPHEHQRKAVALIVIHGFAGVWGTLSVAIFTTSSSFMIQLQGVTMALALSITFAIPILLITIISNKFIQRKKTTST